MPKAYVNGININYKVHGEGHPLVLIFGFGGPRWAWLFQTRAFKKYYMVVTFDNRGAAFGKTDKPSSSYTIKTMADDIIGSMDYLGIDEAHILGYSMGGIIAQELAINHPERVRKLILASTLSTTRQIPSEVLEGMDLSEDFSDEDLRSVNIRKASSLLVTLAFNNRLYRMIVAPIVPILAILGRFKGLMGQIEAIAGCNTLDRLHTIQSPTLVIVGTDDKATLPRSSEEIASRISNAKLVEVDRGAHGYIWEMRGRFNNEVLGFLRDN